MLDTTKNLKKVTYEGVEFPIEFGIEPSGTIQLTENNKTYDVRLYANAEVSVEVGAEFILKEGDILGKWGLAASVWSSWFFDFKPNSVLNFNIDGTVLNGTYTLSGTEIICVAGDATTILTYNREEESIYLEDTVFVKIPQKLIEGSATTNGTYNANEEEADGYSAFVVNVPTGGGTGGLGMALNAGVSEIIDVAGEVTSLRPSAFYLNKDVEILNLPNCSVIGQSGCYGAQNLQEVSAPNCTTVHTYAFGNCKKLSSVYMPNLKYINIGAFSSTSITLCSFPECTTVENGAFQSCYALSEVNLPKVSALSGGIEFRYCSTLKRVDLPICKLLSAETFASCSELSTINIPECTWMGNWAFGGCKALTHVSFPNLVYASGSVFAYTGVQEAYLPKLETVTGALFWGCSKLSSVYMPLCTSLGSYAFSTCYSLSQIDLPNCSIVGGQAFLSCSSLQSVSLPKCTHLSVLAFGSCSTLSYINLPMCTSISTSAFASCYGLVKIDIPECAFLQGNAFYSCRLLEGISIPKGSRLGSSCFRGCSSLSYVILGTSNCSLSNVNAFTQTPMSLSSYLGYFGSIYVPDEYVDTYKASTNWVTYSDRITGISNLPTT